MFRIPRLPALAGALAAATLAAGALAPAAAATTARVSYRDLDLGTSAGQAMLNQRLRRAATRVCGDASSVMLDVTMACRSDAVSRARSDLAAIVAGARPAALR